MLYLFRRAMLPLFLILAMMSLSAKVSASVDLTADLEVVVVYPFDGDPVVVGNQSTAYVGLWSESPTVQEELLDMRPFGDDPPVTWGDHGWIGSTNHDADCMISVNIDPYNAQGAYVYGSFNIADEWNVEVDAATDFWSAGPVEYTGSASANLPIQVVGSGPARVVKNGFPLANGPYGGGFQGVYSEWPLEIRDQNNAAFTDASGVHEYFSSQSWDVLDMWAPGTDGDTWSQGSDLSGADFTDYVFYYDWFMPPGDIFWFLQQWSVEVPVPENPDQFWTLNAHEVDAWYHNDGDCGVDRNDDAAWEP